ncbi:MAG: hypothetical protein HY319_08620 [Armatimonadetes bacterium]|nr:hypothetical protein [Armatimonadota bacterium]
MMIRRILAGALGLLLLSSPLSADDRQVKIFQLTNRPVAATVEVVQALLGPEGFVHADVRLNKLVVRDTPENLALIEQTLREIDVPAPQVRIKVAFQGGRPVSGHVVGAGVYQTGPDSYRVGGTAQAYETDQNVSAQQNLLVMSGERGRIMIGQNLVTVLPYYTYAHHLGLIGANVIFQTVSTGFAVEPLVVGDNVRLTITPWIGYQAAGGRGEILFSESSSTFNARSGDTITISSGSQRERTDTSAFGLILGSGSLERGNSMSILVTPTIEPDWSSPD